MNKITLTTGLILLIAFCSTQVYPQTLTESTYTPNQESQEFLDKIIYTDYSTKSYSSKEEFDEAMKSMIDDLVKINGGDRVKTIREVYYFKNYSEVRGDGMTLYWVYAFFFMQANFTINEALDASLPILGHNDNKLQNVAHDILFGKFGVPTIIIEVGRGKNENLEQEVIDSYKSYIKENPDSYKPIMDFMFQSNPPKALLFALEFHEQNEDKKRLQNDLTKGSKPWLLHYRGSTKQIEKSAVVLKPILDEFSTRDEWWARMYVAELNRQIPSLQSPAIVQRLRQDKDPFIKATMKIMDLKAQKPTRMRHQVLNLK